MNRTPARWMRLVGPLAVLALLAPLAAVRAGAQEEGGDVLRIHQGLYPDVIDPQLGSALAEVSIFVLAYEGLTRVDGNLQTVPGAAESWAFNEDATSITFTLREGLTYSDGSPITAERFRYAIERTCSPDAAGGYQYVLAPVVVGCDAYAGIFPEEDSGTPEPDEAAIEAARAGVGVRAPDERTLEIDFVAPAPYFPTVASLWIFYPVQQEIVEGGADWWTEAENHVGNGPFRITGIEEQQLVSFEPNENYWGGQPAAAGIEYVYVAESQAALEAYRAGDLDTLSVDPAQIPALETDPELNAELLRYGGANTFYINFNLNQAPFEDPQVRKAFALAFDRETYCAEIRNGDCVPVYHWVPEDVLPGTEGELYKFDPAAAQEALAASTYGGAEDLPEISYFFSSDDPVNTARAEWVAGQYRDLLGVELTLEPTEGTTLSSLRRDESTYPQFTIYNWFQDYPDPQNWLSVYWTCATAADFGYCNEEFDQLATEGDTSTDADARVTAYQAAQTILLEDAGGPPIFSAANIYLVKPYVTGYQTTSIDGLWPGERASALTITVDRPE